MLQQFCEYISSGNLFQKSEKVLLAASGGIDSVVMCHLFAEGKFSFAVAHCNFKLRGKDADEDEQFVKRLAEKFSVPFHSVHFDTEKDAGGKRISIQMAARELRYDWLEKTRKKNGYAYIATAHHLNDSIETVLLNIIRGTGISGLHGILPRQGRVIRPLLFAKRAEIETFAKNNKIEYRQDVSNESDKYLRNKIRNQVIPLIREINPSFDTTMLENMERMQSVENVYHRAMDEGKKKLFRLQNKEIFISIKKLQKIAPHKTLVFEMLKEFGFNMGQVEQVIRSFESEPGKIFLSPTHRLLKDRVFLIISPVESKEVTHALIEESDEKISIEGLNLEISKRENKDFTIPESSHTACMDYDLLTFPMKVRRWSKGDYFYPLGMKKKKKKLSDFFIDLKLPVSEKEKIWVVFSGEKIVWVVNHRIDERFKITGKTKKIYILEKV